MGAKIYHIIKKYRNELNGSVIEIGSERGEGSTSFLSSFCFENNLKFYSIDFEKSAYERANLIEHTLAYNCTGEKFLEEIFDSKEKICFAYLDNFDYIYDVLFESEEGLNLIKNQKDIYIKYGIELNNINSQISHFKQSELIEKISYGPSFILFDDSWINEDETFGGKGGTAIPFLISKDYVVIEKSNTNSKKWESFVLVYRKNKKVL